MCRKFCNVNSEENVSIRLWSSLINGEDLLFLDLFSGLDVGS